MQAHRGNWVSNRLGNSYFLLIKSRVNKSEIIIVSFSLNVILALVASSILTHEDPFIFGRNLALAVFSMFATALSVYLYNDLTDREIDKHNNLNRPLATGEVRIEDARNLVITLAIIGITAASIINLKVLLLVLAYFALAFLYSFPRIHLKYKFLLNKMTVGVGTAISYLIGGAVVEMIPAPIFLMAALGFVGGISASTLLDLRDVQGDETQKVRTLPIVWGPRLTVRFSIALVCLIGIATVVGYSQLGFNISFPILASCAFSAWIFVLFPLFRYWNDPSYVVNTVIKRIAPLGFIIQTLTVLGAVLK